MDKQEILNRALINAMHRWESPHPEFTSGFDRRTSDNALLVQFYASLEHAARHHWLNAGRRLIDKTYIQMLWSVQSLTSMKSCSAESIAAAMDPFIQERIQPIWNSLDGMEQSECFSLAQELVETASARLFGSIQSDIAASGILSFMLPQLPIFPMSRGHKKCLTQLGVETGIDSYQDYASQANAIYQALLPELESLEKPVPDYGTESEVKLIQQVVDHSDWWQRRLFDEWLRLQLPDNQDLFTCDSAGQ